MIKEIIGTAIAYLTLQGCAVINSPIYEPNIKKLVEIGELDKRYDCKDKVLIYQKSLNESNIEGCIVCGEKVEHRENWFNDEQKGFGHCWNEVFNAETKTWHSIDTSDVYGDNGWEPQYTKDLEPWIKFGKDSTLSDIINLENSIWKDETKLNAKNFERVKAYKSITEEYDKPNMVPPLRHIR
jgi:hypothetical protein